MERHVLLSDACCSTRWPCVLFSWEYLRKPMMMKKQMLIAVAAAAMLAGLAPLALAQNVAIVNGKAVPKARADALAAQVTRAGRQLTPELLEQVKQEVIAREVFM